MHPRAYRYSLSFTALLVAVLVLPGCPLFFPPPPTVRVVEDVAYAVGYVAPSADSSQYFLRELKMDVYSPRANDDTLKPALLLVHGGSFQGGSKRDEPIVEYAEYFAERGYIVFAIDYRLEGDFPPAPSGWSSVLGFGTARLAAAHAAIVDVKAAVRHVRARAADYGIDPNRIGVLGESAGAIAAVPAAVTPSSEFSSDGPDFPIPAFNNAGVSTRIQAYAHFWGNADHVLLSVSPADAPTMIVHGTEDTQFFTPFRAAERFQGALQLWRVPHVFYEAVGFAHGAWDYRAGNKDLKTLTREFFDEHLIGLEKDAIDLRSAVDRSRQGE